MNNPEEYVMIMAKILDLAIPDRYLNSVVENWQRLQEIASLVTEFPLEDDGESALSFEPWLFLCRSIQNRQTSALEVINRTLAEIEAKNRHLNCFTDILHPRALAQAQKIDLAIADGEPVGVLAGVPFAVKNLFDIEGIVTAQLNLLKLT